MIRPGAARLFRGLALALGMASLVVGPAAAEHPNHARGFRPGHVYDFEQIENVNLFNGNLSLTIPIGQEYPLGPNLSYGLTLTYSGNLWEWEEQCPDYPTTSTCFLQSYPRQTNAGLGWELSLGEISTEHDPRNNDSRPVYVTPDQGDHRIEGSLHPNGETFPSDPQIGFTQDSTYLRRNTSANTIEFPDGTVQQFNLGGQLTEIRDRFTPINKLQVYYDSEAPDVVCNKAHQWELRDSYDRVHCVTFGTVAGQLVVTSVKLQKFGGGQAEYTFEYDDASFSRTCNNPLNSGDKSTVTVPRLTAINLPDGSRFKMAGNPPDGNPYYHDETSSSTAGCDPHVEGLNGALERIDLPTGGRYEYAWRRYGFPDGSASFRSTENSYVDSPLARSIGLDERRHLSAGGSVLGTWTYRSELTPFNDNYPSRNRELVNTVTDPLGHYTKHYFSVYPGSPDLPPNDPPGGWTKDEYGLPFTRRIQDGTSGRYLSEEVFDRNDTLLRTTYVRYERSGSSSANPRVASEKTVFNDDPVGGGLRYQSVDLSDFDGLGHYRQQVSGGNFGGTNARTERTEYNPGRSISDIPDPTEPWVLNTFTKKTTTEGGEQATRELCFDSTTGFLKRMRSWKSTSTVGSGGSTDVILERVPDSRGFASSETYYGGDVHLVPTGDLCGLDLRSSTKVLDQHHTYSCGVLATSRIYDSGGSPLSFLSVDQTIDCKTGRVSKSRDTTGLETTYTYDSSGRLTKEDLPTGEGADVYYTYSKAVGGTPAKVTIQAKNGSTVLTEEQVEFDAFGRVDLERRRMPDGTWSERSTKTSVLGNVYQRSEWEAAGDPDPSNTDIGQFDPFGRPGKITLPDGHEIVMTYDGVSRRTTKVTVGTSVNGDGSVHESEAGTTEFFDRFGRLYDIREPGYPSTAARTLYQYDVLGNLDRVEMNPDGTSQVRTFDYDGRGFLTSETHPELGTSVLYSQYDALGNPGRVQRGGWDLRYTYDAARRLLKIHEQGSNRDWKEWTYATANATDPVDGSLDRSKGKLRSETRHNWVLYPGTTTQWIDPKVTETYTYSGVGGRIARVATDVAVGGSPHFDYSVTYDQLGEVTSRSYPRCTMAYCTEADVARTVSQSYSRGFLTGVPGVASSFTYHPNGLVKQILHANGVSLIQERDPSDMVRPHRILTSGADSNMDSGVFQYDGAGNIVAMGSERYIYDLQSRVSKGDLEVTSLLCDDAAYHGTIESTSVTHEACNTLTADTGYTVTGTGNVTLRAGSKIVLDGTVHVQAGGYLKAEVDPTLASGQQGIVAKSQSYEYDVFGNLLSADTVIGQSSDLRTFGTNSSTNRLTVPGYDTSGNITSWAGTTFEYDPFNMLRHSSGNVYVYGPGDERIWQIDWTGGAASTNWIETWTLRGLDGTPLRQYLDVGGNGTGHWSLFRDYVWGGGSLLAAYGSSGTLHFFSDHLGSPRLVTDSSGNVVARHRYYPYGEEATDPTQDVEVIKFTGHERDFHGTGTTDDLDYMHARYFSVNLGRFLSIDPVGGNPSAPQSWNLYGYVVGNPVKYSDPEGLFPIFPWGEIPFFFDDITVTAQMLSLTVRPFNPFTGVAGLQSLAAGRGFLNSLQGTGDSFLALTAWATGQLPRNGVATPEMAAQLANTTGMENIRAEYKRAGCKDGRYSSDYQYRELLTTTNLTGQLVGGFVADITSVSGGMVVVDAQNTWGLESATRFPGVGNRGNASVQQMLSGSGGFQYPKSILENRAHGPMGTATLHYIWAESLSCP